MRRLRLAILSLSIALFGALSPSAAVAAEEGTANKDRARSLALTGYEEMLSGRNERAVDLFLEAERLYHAPTIVLLVAQAREKLGQIVEARAAYRSIVEEDLARGAPREFVDAKVEAKRSFEALEGRFATVQILVPGGAPNDATLLIDGVELTPYDEPHEQNPGIHRVTVKGRGGVSVTQVVALKAGDAERMMVPLAALDPYGPGSLFTPAAITFGVGIAGLGAGAVLAGIAASKSGDAGATDAHTFTTASVVSFAAGGASLAASAILLYVGRRDADAPSDTDRATPPSSTTTTNAARAKGATLTASLIALPGHLALAGTF